LLLLLLLLQVAKGARDFLPDQMAIREAAFGIITSVFKRHGEQQQQQKSFSKQQQAWLTLYVHPAVSSSSHALHWLAAVVMAQQCLFSARLLQMPCRSQSAYEHLMLVMSCCCWVPGAVAFDTSIVDMWHFA
jgi:hypothetical protein